MRLHGNNPVHRRYRVWHCPSCAFVPRVLWVDDETSQWFQVASDEAARKVIVFGDADPPGVVHQARRIEVLHDMQLVLIDPLAELDAEPVESAETLQLEGLA